MNEEEITQVAEWIWRKTHLDKDDESWCGMMFEDALRELRKLLSIKREGNNEAEKKRRKGHCWSCAKWDKCTDRFYINEHCGMWKDSKK